MASNERLRGVQVHRPIIYGSHARLLSEQEKESAPAGHTHKWTVFLTSATAPPPDPATLSSNDASPEMDMDYLPGGADDLSYLIKKVTFRLHETYANPSRVFDKPPFQVTETGWGEFTVTIRVQFVPESGEKPMTLAHPIKLHHWGPPIEAPPPVTTSDAVGGEGGGDGAGVGTGSAVPTPAGTPAPVPAASGDVKEEGQGEDVKMEGKVEDSTNTSTPAPAPVDPATSNTPDPNSAAPADSGTPASPLEASVIVAQPQPISIAQKYPVHSWQYDELVFTDPTTTFLELMNAHPPTALPPKNRRARDQREGHDSREGGKKGKKARQSAGPGSAIKGLMSGNMASGEKEKGLAAIPPVGIPGEPGSADVPLEFSQEMEKGEWNRLNEARVRIVEEMDSWRERLIAQEKELARLKEEMKV